MRDHPIIPIVAVLAYAVLIFGGQYAMKDRKPWNLRGLMALWNLSLSVFSWIGMFRTLPQLLHNLYYGSLRDNLCLDRKFWLRMFACRGFFDKEITAFDAFVSLRCDAMFDGSVYLAHFQWHCNPCSPYCPAGFYFFLYRMATTRRAQHSKNNVWIWIFRTLGPALCSQ